MLTSLAHVLSFFPVDPRELATAHSGTHIQRHTTDTQEKTPDAHPALRSGDGDLKFFLAPPHTHTYIDNHINTNYITYMLTCNSFEAYKNTYM